MGDALAAGAWIVDPDHDQPTRGTITVDAPRCGLTETEFHIVESWFSAGEAVNTDPWFEPIGNGRHRLWSTLPHYSRALVPIQGEALLYANPVDTDWDRAGWLDLFREHVDQLRGVAWFDTSDKLNARFVEALRSAACGDFPQPV